MMQHHSYLITMEIKMEAVVDFWLKRNEQKSCGDLNSHDEWFSVNFN